MWKIYAETNILFFYLGAYNLTRKTKVIPVSIIARNFFCNRVQLHAVRVRIGQAVIIGRSFNGERTERGRLGLLIFIYKPSRRVASRI